MNKSRSGVAAVVLLVELGLAVLGVLLHHGVTAEYGDITDSAWEGLAGGFSAGVDGLSLALVAVVALLAASVSSRSGTRLTALVIPVAMVAAMLAVTPAALTHKLEVQYDEAPRCLYDEDMGAGPGARAAREAQRALDSIDHVGHFGGGGATGVGGCDRALVLTEHVDVLRHYRVAAVEAGWRLVEDGSSSVRAQRGRMAFEVVACAGGGVVWAGRRDAEGAARCDQL